jgi:acetyl-CoA C-acetyltransferase
MPLDPRHPVIAGAAQFVQRVDDPYDAIDPLGMMETALRAAADDAGAPALLQAVDKIYLPRGTWRYGDPGKVLAERIGADNPRTSVGIISGHIVQIMIDRACQEIAEGKHDVIAIVGGESEHSKRRLRKIDPDALWEESDAGEPDEKLGSYGSQPILASEKEAGALLPAASFALCETSLRYAREETPAAHRRRIAELSARLSKVASDNPSAWIQRPIDAEEIRVETPQNRMVNYPYTKLMTSNIAVDQSAALILCSTETAARMGVPDAKRVYLQAAVEMNHVAYLSARQKLHEHPGMIMAAERLLEITGVEPRNLGQIELYSCFPFAVQASAAALGIDETRPLTVTGGLTFSGGPFGNYVAQAMARMVELLRRKPGDVGLVGSVGGTFQKFAYATYSTEPGATTMPAIKDVSDAFARLPERPWREGYRGAATIESYTVHAEASGPSRATFACLTDAGERVWASSDDPDLLGAILRDEEFCGLSATIAEGRLTPS